MTSEQILSFWFTELKPNQRFMKDEELDKTMRERFLSIHKSAAGCELWKWRSTPEGRLAEIIILDQFSRNIFRDTPQAFAADSLALALAQEAIWTGDDKKIDKSKRAFLYMPFMHSESKVIHDRAVRIFTDLGEPGTLDYEIRHKAIIDRFGRYPHRNKILGRMSTPEEIEFLEQPGSAF